MLLDTYVLAAIENLNLSYLINYNGYSCINLNLFDYNHRSGISMDSMGSIRTAYFGNYVNASNWPGILYASKR